MLVLAPGWLLQKNFEKMVLEQGLKTSELKVRGHMSQLASEHTGLIHVSCTSWTNLKKELTIDSFVLHYENGYMVHFITRL